MTHREGVGAKQHRHGDQGERQSVAGAVFIEAAAGVWKLGGFGRDKDEDRAGEFVGDLERYRVLPGFVAIRDRGRGQGRRDRVATGEIDVGDAGSGGGRATADLGVAGTGW